MEFNIDCDNLLFHKEPILTIVISNSKSLIQSFESNCIKNFGLS